MGIEYEKEEELNPSSQKNNNNNNNDNNNMNTLIFTYGTLKRGFSNHTLMQDLIRTGDASFRGVHRTKETYPLVCGPYKVPFLLNLSGESGSQRVTGELYAVTLRGLERLDELEGTSRGHYERLPIRVEEKEEEEEEEEKEEVEVEVEAEAYFGHRSYAKEMWRRSGRRGYGAYGEKEAKGYVRRKDRPQGLTFLQQIQVFVSSPLSN